MEPEPNLGTYIVFFVPPPILTLLDPVLIALDRREEIASLTCFFIKVSSAGRYLALFVLTFHVFIALRYQIRNPLPVITPSTNPPPHPVDKGFPIRTRVQQFKCHR